MMNLNESGEVEGFTVQETEKIEMLLSEAAEYGLQAEIVMEGMLKIQRGEAFTPIDALEKALQEIT